MLTVGVLDRAKSVSTGGDRVSSVPIWAMLSIAVAALLSPVFTFLMAIAVEILIGSLMDAGLPVRSRFAGFC